MAQTCGNLLVHLIFSTKQRKPLIRPEIRSNLFAYLGGIIREMRGTAIIINGTVDHVHVLARIRPVNSPAEIARDIFASAEALKLRNYFTYLGRELIDDHAHLNVIGIPTLDIIDFDYAWWHTADDTMDKIRAQSLQTVGSVALYYLSKFALK